MSRAQQHLAVRKQGGAVVAALLAKHCLGRQLTTALDTEFGLLAAQSPTAVVLDCTKVEFMDSQTVKLIVRLNRALRRQGGALTLCGVNSSYREVFRITMLDRVLVIGDSIEGVLAASSEQWVAESPRSLPNCACCAWPREAECRFCGVGFCSEHGCVVAHICQQHRWKAWVGWVVVGITLLLGLRKLWEWAGR